MKSIKILLCGIMLALISLFFMGLYILNYHNSIHGFFAVAFLVVGVFVFLVGFFKKAE